MHQQQHLETFVFHQDQLMLKLLQTEKIQALPQMNHKDAEKRKGERVMNTNILVIPQPFMLYKAASPLLKYVFIRIRIIAKKAGRVVFIQDLLFIRRFNSNVKRPNG